MVKIKYLEIVSTAESLQSRCTTGCASGYLSFSVSTQEVLWSKITTHQLKGIANLKMFG